MSRSERGSASGGLLPSPWPVLGIGAALVAGGWLWGLAAEAGAKSTEEPPFDAPALRAVILTVGLIAVGSAIALYCWAPRRST
jgi:hypothetical protein